MDNLYLYEVIPSGNRWVVVNSQTRNCVSKRLKDRSIADKLATFLTKFIPELKLNLDSVDEIIGECPMCGQEIDM